MTHCHSFTFCWASGIISIQMLLRKKTTVEKIKNHSILNTLLPTVFSFQSISFAAGNKSQQKSTQTNKLDAPQLRHSGN